MTGLEIITILALLIFIVDGRLKQNRIDKMNAEVDEIESLTKDMLEKVQLLGKAYDDEISINARLQFELMVANQQVANYKVGHEHNLRLIKNLTIKEKENEKRNRDIGNTGINHHPV